MAVRVLVTSLVTAALWSLVLTGVATPSDAPSSKPTVTMLGQDALSVTPDQGDDTAKTSLALLNQDDEQRIASVTLVATGAKGVKVRGFSPKIAGAGVTLVRVTLTGMKGLERKVVNGQLVATVEGVHLARAVKITPSANPAVGSWPVAIVVGTVVAFMLLALVACVGDGVKLDAKAPGPKWSFDSWGTTLTTVGAALGTVLGAATFPTVPDQISKDAVVQLNLLFGVLVIVAPFTFQALRTSAGAQQPDAFYGTNATLLAACAMTGAAVLGEIATLGLLGWELAGPDDWGWLAVLGAAVVFWLAWRYFRITARALVRTDWETVAKDEAAAQPQEVVVTVRLPGDAAAEILAGDSGATTEQRVAVTSPIPRPRAFWPLP